jgi:hypothetical protein
VTAVLNQLVKRLAALPRPRKVAPAPPMPAAALPMLADLARRVAGLRRQRPWGGAASAYDAHKRQVSARQSAQVAAKQEIGPLPPVADPDRRARAAASLRAFCEIYFAQVFFRAWSPDHLTALARFEEVIRRGGRFALAMPREGGKSAILRAGALWAIFYGLRRYVTLTVASGKKIHEEFGKLKTICESNEFLGADFPEILFPIRALERITSRQRGQRYQGIHTRIQWLDDLLVFPRMPGSPASESVIFCCSLQGAEVKGPAHQTANGELRRPDLVLIDDPQTRESAHSPIQTKQRMDLVHGDLLPQGGAVRELAAFATVTRTAPNDLSGQILDRKAWPSWRGESFPLIYEWPKRTDLWDQYLRIRAEDQEAGGTGDKATEFYRAHREEMDAGARPAWPERFNENEISAIQHAYNYRLQLGDEMFFAEYQQAPKVEEGGQDGVTPAIRICQQLSGYPRGAIPRRAEHLTAFIDVGEKLLWWMVVAWADDFTGWIVDYGTYPDQQRWYFTMADAAATIRRRHQGVQIEEAVRLALEAEIEALQGKTWKREDGAVMTLKAVLVDRGHLPEVVDMVCRRIGGVLLPSHGLGIGPNHKAISEYEKKPGERIGHHWWMPRTTGTQMVRHIRPDVNYWKSFVHARLSMGLAESGSLSLNGKNAAEHRLLAEHLTSEPCDNLTSETRGRTVAVWGQPRGGRDNHWFDCLVGCAVGASYVGLEVPGAGGRGGRKTKAAKLPNLSDLIKG